MTINPPTIDPVQIPGTIIDYRPVTDIAPFTYRAGMTYQTLLENLRVYVVNTLTNYTVDEFSEFSDSWQENLSTLIDAVNTALKTQTDNNAAALAQTLAEIVAGANVPLNDATIIAVLKAANSASAAYLARPVTGIATPEMFRDQATIASDGTVSDWAPAISAAFAAGYADIELSNAYYFIRTPIRIPSNRGPRIFTRGGKKAGYLNVVMNNPDRAAIEYVGTRGGGEGYNYAGITMENVCFLGNDSTCHAVWIQDVSYPNFSRVNISGFRGAGLLVDNCEDGAFDIEIHDCGRTAGDYTSLADRSNNLKTVYSGLDIRSTLSGSHNNMLRFTGEIEQMKTSPYVMVNDAGAINLWFNDIHAETRDSADFGAFDFLACPNGADMEFKGMYVAIEMRTGFLLSGWGSYRFIGGRSLNTIKMSDTSTVGQLKVIGCTLTDLIWASSNGAHSATDCTIRDVTIDYPGGGPFRITGCNILRNVKVTNKAASETGVIFDRCRIAGTALADTTTAECEIRNSHVVGDFSWQSTNGKVENTKLDGAVSAQQFNMTFKPVIREYWLTAPPQYGNHVPGDRVWNSNPTPGNPMGWVCVTAGAPGTWKAFGTISS